MVWNEKDRRWMPHPDCTCGQFEVWKLRGINRPCYCRWLRPLDWEGRPERFPILDALAGRGEPESLHFEASTDPRRVA